MINFLLTNLIAQYDTSHILLASRASIKTHRSCLNDYYIKSNQWRQQSRGRIPSTARYRRRRRLLLLLCRAGESPAKPPRTRVRTENGNRTSTLADGRATAEDRSERGRAEQGNRLIAIKSRGRVHGPGPRGGSRRGARRF